jgi:hypothetical protein
MKAQKGGQWYSSTLSLTLALEGGGCFYTTPQPPYPREWPGSRPQGGLDACEESRIYQDLIRGTSSP